MKDDGAEHHHTQPDRRYDGEPENHSGEHRQDQTDRSHSLGDPDPVYLGQRYSCDPGHVSLELRQRGVKAFFHSVSRNARESPLRTIHNAIAMGFLSFLWHPFKAMEVAIQGFASRRSAFASTPSPSHTSVHTTGPPLICSSPFNMVCLLRGGENLAFRGFVAPRTSV
jgi:hypothetical protein